MWPRSSSTTKSRTFSQTSAKVRGSRVPSPEYAAINSWICSASGRRASRVRMDVLPHAFHSPPGVGDGLPHSRRRGTTGQVVDSKHSRQSQREIEILIKSGIQLAQFVQGQIFQLTLSSDAGLHRFADYFVGEAKRNS